MNQRHLTELLTEGRFTTVSVYFPADTGNPQPVKSSQKSAMYAPAPGPTAPWAEATPGRVPFSAVKGGVLSVSEMAAMSAAFPFINKEVPSQTYTFKVSHELAKTLKNGDSVVIPHHGDEGYAIAKVWAVHQTAQIDYNSRVDYKWIVQRVDAEQYLENIAREANFRHMLEESEKARKRAEVRASLLAQLTPTDPEAYNNFVEAMKLLGVENAENVIPRPTELNVPEAPKAAK